MERYGAATVGQPGRRLTLTDGRQIGYAEIGDPEGSPVFFMHGWGDSRLTRHPNDAATAAKGIRLITMDRPGAGLRAFHQHFARRLPACDQEVLSNPAVRANLEQGAAEALRRGARGLAYGLGLLFGRPWEFDPLEIQIPTHLWFGTDDPLVPLWMGHRLANDISRAHRTVVQGEGHLLLFTHWEEILHELTDRHRTGRSSRPEATRATAGTRR